MLDKDLRLGQHRMVLCDLGRKRPLIGWSSMMKTASRRAAPPAPLPEEPVLAEEELSVPEEGAIVSHPDGFYWVSADGRQEFGPFDTLEEARADMMKLGDSTWEPGESLREAEDELGISDWVDPDSGGPAEDTHLRFSDD
jgi:hypothetical protein